MSNAWAIYLRIGDNFAKAVLIPDNILFSSEFWIKGGLYCKLPFGDELAYH